MSFTKRPKSAVDVESSVTSHAAIPVISLDRSCGRISTRKAKARLESRVESSRKPPQLLMVSVSAGITSLRGEWVQPKSLRGVICADLPLVFNELKCSTRTVPGPAAVAFLKTNQLLLFFDYDKIELGIG